MCSAHCACGTVSFVFFWLVATKSRWNSNTVIYAFYIFTLCSISWNTCIVILSVFDGSVNTLIVLLQLQRLAIGAIIFKQEYHHKLLWKIELIKSIVSCCLTIILRTQSWRDLQASWSGFQLAHSVRSSGANHPNEGRYAVLCSGFRLKSPGSSSARTRARVLARTRWRSRIWLPISTQNWDAST